MYFMSRYRVVKILAWAWYLFGQQDAVLKRVPIILFFI